MTAYPTPPPWWQDTTRPAQLRRATKRHGRRFTRHVYDLERRRIERALDLTKCAGLTRRQVARQCGYQGPSSVQYHHGRYRGWLMAAGRPHSRSALAAYLRRQYPDYQVLRWAVSCLPPPTPPSPKKWWGGGGDDFGYRPKQRGPPKIPDPGSGWKVEAPDSRPGPLLKMWLASKSRPSLDTKKPSQASKETAT